MHNIKNNVKLCLIYVAVVLLAGGQPMVAMAETAETIPPASQEQTSTTPPASETTQAEPDKNYTYDPVTNRWSGDDWAWNPATGQYEAVVAPLVVEEQPVIVPPALDAPTTSAAITSDTDAVIDNTLNSNATTGNAAVSTNTTGGNATTGDAAAIATLMNTINSSVSGDGAQFATFVTDVVGDVHGDIMLYPMLLKAMLAAATNPTESSITANNSAAITNNLNLNATSGDADVTTNTTAGNATTGTANTVANVMNIINSIIAANQSFVGTVNIYGNLDGDILVAPDFLPQLLASNNGDSSAPANSLAVSSEDTQKIINNIDLTAISGDATVANNTNAGSATTGGAKTNLVLLNLSGHQIVAQDSLLVFVNVLGQWVGLILDAPQGTSAAALGTGVTTNNVAPDLTIDVNNTSQIVNNIALHSQSGDATVENNTNAGNATSGNATASANVANISGSQIGTSGWFGVLFINVFGNWFGSFGVDTARGTPVTPGRGGVSEAAPAVNPMRPFQFIPRQESARSVAASTTGSQGPRQGTPPVEEIVTEEQKDEPVALSAYTPSVGTPVAQASGAVAQSQFDFLPFIASAFLIGIGIIAIRTILAFVRERNALA
jgi:hypothetical protein